MATATAPSASSADLGGSPPPPQQQPSAASSSTVVAKSRSLQQRKRKRLNAVLDKISNHVNGNYASSSNNSENNNETDVGEKVDNMFGRTEQNKFAAASASSTEESGTSRATTSGAGPMLMTTSRKNNAALRRELWRDNQQQSVNDDNAVKTFRFDSQDRERYLSGDSMVVNPNVLAVHEEVEHDTFSPGRSPHSSMSSPQVSVESPRICFSPLRIKDSIEEEDADSKSIPKLSVRGCESPLPAHSNLHHSNLLEPSKLHMIGLSRPISPNPSLSPTTPASPSTTPLHALRHLPAYLTEVYRRRCLSDTDLSSSWDDLKAKYPGTLPPNNQQNVATNHQQRVLLQPYQRRPLPASSKGSSLESEASSTTQESPLDLSVRSNVSSTTKSSSLAASMESIRSTSLVTAKGRSRSSTSRGHSAEHRDRLSLDRLDVVEAAASGGASGSTADVAYVCPICGQMFSLHDRLAKHMASRHKSRSTDSGTKAYLCDVCRRSFARSDMLTRHMRLHTGIKPYTCRVCGQVFSRSDHLSTHQRTHTGEKPYRCPSCPYAACRRDMITRHMRTHTRYELQESTSVEEGADEAAAADSPHPGSLGSTAGPSRSISSESGDPPPQAKPKPPSPMDTEEEKSMERASNP